MLINHQQPTANGHTCLSTTGYNILHIAAISLQICKLPGCTWSIRADDIQAYIAHVVPCTRRAKRAEALQQGITAGSLETMATIQRPANDDTSNPRSCNSADENPSTGSSATMHSGDKRPYSWPKISSTNLNYMIFY